MRRRKRIVVSFIIVKEIDMGALGVAADKRTSEETVVVKEISLTLARGAVLDVRHCSWLMLIVLIVLICGKNVCRL